MKAFGADAEQVRRLFEKRGVTRFHCDAAGGFIQFHPGEARHLQGRGVELALSVNVLEEREDGMICRELKLQRALPNDCCPDRL